MKLKLKNFENFSKKTIPRQKIYYTDSKLKTIPEMEKGSSKDEPYIMKKNIIKFCYVYIIYLVPYMNFIL